MSLNPNILPALDQLGLLEELRAVSCRSQGMTVYDSNMRVVATHSGTDKDIER